MIFSQAMLLVFAMQWLIGQYNEQQAQLKENLTELFTDVQQRISDSLLTTTHVIDTAADLRVVYDANSAPPCKDDTNKEVKLSKKGVHNILSSIHISPTMENHLFRMDSIIFGELFASQMRDKGWNFNSEWIHTSDSGKRANVAAIFIRSNTFTNTKGIVIKDYRGYLVGKMVPQMVFVLILLVLTAAAFMIAYKSLRAQIKLGQMKDDFMSNMSHELKTPIATVKIALEALNNYNIIDNPKLNREYLGMAASEMDRLELLATRVLNTSLLESGKIYLQQESCNLSTLVQEVLQTMDLRFKKQGATVAFEATGNDFTVPADRLHIQGVLVNLIDNSLKYGEAPVHIDIRLAETNGKVQLALTDNGPGIPEEYREKIFEKFFRVPNGNMHNTKGHGLGLSYALQVMRQHNGNINVRNMAEGGCMFTLSLPHP